MTALNPLLKVGKQMSEIIMRHQNLSKEEAREIIRKEDIELGFIKEDYNNSKYNENEENENENVHDKLSKMLEKSTNYFENVVGRKIKNVELFIGNSF